MSTLEESFYFQAIHNLLPDEPRPHAHLFQAIFLIEVEEADTIQVRHELLCAALAPLCFELQETELINELGGLGDGSMEAVSGRLLRLSPQAISHLRARVAGIRLGMAETDERGKLHWHWLSRTAGVRVSKRPA